jgi:hypothetical protein
MITPWRVTLLVVFLLGLVYLLAPGKISINDFAPLPNSIKSQLSGDTYQNPNIAAYFSDYWRADVTHFYYQQASYLNIFGISIPPLFINHPPEEAFQYIRDQQESTYLEEYFYPFRDQFFVNGWEPVDINGKVFRADWSPLIYDDVHANSKATLRFYPSKPIYRVAAYLGMWVGGFGLFFMAIRIKKEKF